MDDIMAKPTSRDRDRDHNKVDHNIVVVLRQSFLLHSLTVCLFLRTDCVAGQALFFDT